MSGRYRSNDSVHWYVNDLASRVIAKSGIPSDRFHLGKLILQSFQDDPDFVLQIDGATDESETCKSLLKRSIQCAIALRNFGLKRGDVIVLMAPNHLDVSVPYYAALFLGVIVAAVDRKLRVNELQNNFTINEPKVVFCQRDKASDVQLVLNKLNLDALIVTFDKGDHVCHYAEFLQNYGDDSAIDQFKPADFDPEETIAFLISTSGTTGLPKAAAITHKNIAISNPYVWVTSYKFPTPTRMALIGSPLQWMTAVITFVMSSLFRYTRLQSSDDLTREHAYHLINKYRPTHTIFSPTFLTTLLNPSVRNQCDFSCFELVYLGGSPVPRELVDEFKLVAPRCVAVNLFGMSEITSVGFMPDNSPIQSTGKPLGCLQYRLVDIDTQEDIHKPNMPGELWVKGPGIFKEYYKNPEATAEAFAEGRWFKTGDLFYRDENWNYYYVERIKLLLKYKSHQISPIELETVIRSHSSVLDVVVTGIPDRECGDLPVACVVKRPGHKVTAEEIKILVKDSLTDSKQLRGGVIFLEQLPMTTTTKVHRRKIKELAILMDRE
ncbi:luciferin 4-monooxygenase-like [Battus philenor]|uniref:luciferin 4-monooxygenase-like n=1 Tax=Battus philenor TaxID=42288 RepID=UPI0035CED1D1